MLTDLRERLHGGQRWEGTQRHCSSEVFLVASPHAGRQTQVMPSPPAGGRGGRPLPPGLLSCVMSAFGDMDTCDPVHATTTGRSPGHGAGQTPDASTQHPGFQLHGDTVDPTGPTLGHGHPHLTVSVLPRQFSWSPLLSSLQIPLGGGSRCQASAQGCLQSWALDSRASVSVAAGPPNHIPEGLLHV